MLSAESPCDDMQRQVLSIVAKLAGARRAGAAAHSRSPSPRGHSPSPPTFRAHPDCSAAEPAPSDDGREPRRRANLRNLFTRWRIRAAACAARRVVAAARLAVDEAGRVARAAAADEFLASVKAAAAAEVSESVQQQDASAPASPKSSPARRDPSPSLVRSGSGTPPCSREAQLLAEVAALDARLAARPLHTARLHAGESEPLPPDTLPPPRVWRLPSSCSDSSSASQSTPRRSLTPPPPPSPPSVQDASPSPPSSAREPPPSPPGTPPAGSPGALSSGGCSSVPGFGGGSPPGWLERGRLPLSPLHSSSPSPAPSPVHSDGQLRLSSLSRVSSDGVAEVSDAAQFAAVAAELHSSVATPPATQLRLDRLWELQPPAVVRRRFAALSAGRTAVLYYAGDRLPQLRAAAEGGYALAEVGGLPLVLAACASAGAPSVHGRLTVLLCKAALEHCRQSPPVRGSTVQRWVTDTPDAVLPCLLAELQLISEAANPPPPQPSVTLEVVAPEHPEVGGVYRLAGPGEWLQASGEAVLRDDSNGGWLLSSNARDAASGVGVLASAAQHHGRTPDSVRRWRRSDGTRWCSSETRVVRVGGAE
eukprot:TRINITY_DN16306_c0_g1_i1.p1 TRINITY_DN16306_c0_g1~~TRINITY_DN16306_c0_g1_i1.p1  ORF type:complete len:593 (+),score=180.83 TRINITY_DN16306_c0_g1_i1:2117-3895(+)